MSGISYEIEKNTDEKAATLARAALDALKEYEYQ